MRADLLLTADIHIRADSPKCRVDDFQQAMWAKWAEILTVSANSEGCPILIAGDLGQRAEWPNWLLEKFINSVLSTKAGPIFVIQGQHDAISHNLDLLPKSALGVLAAAEIITVLKDTPITIERENRFMIYPFPWGKPIEMVTRIKEGNVIAIAHTMVIEEMPHGWEIGKGVIAKSLLDKFDCFDIICSGDNHKPFVQEKNRRYLVNCGSMMRTTADQIAHRPRVYLWDENEKLLTTHYLKIRRGVITREHIEIEEAKNKRMEALIASVQSNQEVKFSFESNMEQSLRENPASPGEERKIWQSMETV